MHIHNIVLTLCQIYNFNVWNATFCTCIVQRTSFKHTHYDALKSIVHVSLTALLEYDCSIIIYQSICTLCVRCIPAITILLSKFYNSAWQGAIWIKN